MKRIATALFVVLLSFDMFACIENYEDSIAFIDIKENSFNDLYDIDEQLNLDAIILNVKFKSGQVVDVPCTRDMVVGFDTSTTGDKMLYILYNNTKSPFVEYKVVNKGNETVAIKTSCRLSMVIDLLPNATSYAFSITKGDLEKVSAISFTIKSTSNLGVDIDKSNVEITNLCTGWKAESQRRESNTLKVLVYKKSGMDIASDTSIATINIIEQTKVAIVVESIVVSDGEKDYALPNIK